MMLTGESKVDFLKYCGQSESFMLSYADIYLHTLIVEWLDSVGIYIHVDNLTNVVMPNGEHAWRSYIKRRCKNRRKCAECCDTRQLATESAIKQANEIYNSRK